MYMTQDQGHGIYRKMMRPTPSESPATYAEEDIPDNPPLYIREQ